MQVGLHTTGGQALTSLVTRESADLLGLAPGLAVLALCKATAVQITQPSANSLVNGCGLMGVVADVSPGPGPQELALTLPGGNLWVGFATEGTVLQVGDAACGLFAPSAVVIGLAG